MNDYLEVYRQYLQSINPALDGEFLIRENQATNWEEPETALDFHNCAVMALIEAENSEMRSMYVEMAFQSLQRVLEMAVYPLATAHLALAYHLIGDRDLAAQNAFNALVQVVSSVNGNYPTGLIYALPDSHRQELLTDLLETANYDEQTLLLATEILYRSSLAFYNQNGMRFLELANHVNPHSCHLNRQLGIAKLINQQLEGLFHLHRAVNLNPEDSGNLQALYLAYRGLGQTQLANFWLETAKATEESWTNLDISQPFTYLKFDDNITLAVEASFRSFVTGVLLAQGDWFEAEMEFWRNSIQEGMTIIDVGANAGVYTFSAANRVGKTGKVIAIEPFSQCIQLLEETCRVNQLSWVYPCRGAASHQEGNVYLSLYQASELNEVITDEKELKSENYEQVPCFTLDSLIDTYQLERVDLLKIDAEGHEVPVLEGSQRLIARFSPIILYENIAGNQGSNLPVAEWLKGKGYRLYRYRPYLQELLEIESEDDFQGILNVIALPEKAV
jgi:FkbM family methyltransferase